MSYINFPGLGIEFNIERIAFRIGNFGIHWYAILIVSAFIIAMVAYKKNDGKFGIKFNDVFDLSLYVMPIAIISARIYFIIFNFDQYIANPIAVFNMRTRRLSYIWWNYRRGYHMLCILQEKEN